MGRLINTIELERQAAYFAQSVGIDDAAEKSEAVDFDNDNHEVVRDGKSETIKMLAQVWIEHKGHRVKVGSGWSQEQRLQYMDGSIVGKIITVQYFEETYNDKGGISLRFPTVKIVHGDKREV
jgi:ribonuclease I